MKKAAIIVSGGTFILCVGRILYILITNDGSDREMGCDFIYGLANSFLLLFNLGLLTGKSPKSEVKEA